MQPMRQIRDVIALAMLAVCAYTDIKERNIYLAPLAVSSAGAVLICLITGTSFILSVIIGIMIIVVTSIMRRYIGSGDGYLLAALILVAEPGPALFSMLAGSVLAAVFAAVKTVIGNIKIRTIPLAPFVMAGFIIMLISYE